MEFENTWSNIGYLYVGLLILFRNATLSRLYPLCFGISMVALGLFSGLYHAQPAKDFYRHLDVATIYWVLPILSAYAVYGLFFRTPSVEDDSQAQRIRNIAMVIFLASLGTAFAFLSIISSDILAGGLILLVGVLMGFALFTGKTATPLNDGEKAYYITLSAVMLVSSGFCRLFDGRDCKLVNNVTVCSDKLLCSEFSPVQAHALWHILSACALFLAFEFFARVFQDGSRVIPVFRTVGDE